MTPENGAPIKLKENAPYTAIPGTASYICRTADLDVPAERLRSLAHAFWPIEYISHYMFADSTCILERGSVRAIMRATQVGSLLVNSAASKVFRHHGINLGKKVQVVTHIIASEHGQMRGHDRTLLEHALRCADERGGEVVIVPTDADPNTARNTLYRSCGMQQVGCLFYYGPST